MTKDEVRKKVIAEVNPLVNSLRRFRDVNTEGSLEETVSYFEKSELTIILNFCFNRTFELAVSGKAISSQKKSSIDLQVEENLSRLPKEPEDEPPFLADLSYQKLNEKEPGTKTFRDLNTHHWYHERELLEWFTQDEINSIKH